jgi:hypothetical protein
MGPDFQLLDPDSDVILVLTRYVECDETLDADVTARNELGKAKPFLKIDNVCVCEEGEEIVFLYPQLLIVLPEINMLPASEADFAKRSSSGSRQNI